MKRDLVMILAILGISAGMAVASNVGWHKLHWIRQTPTSQTGEKNGGPATGTTPGVARNPDPDPIPGPMEKTGIDGSGGNGAPKNGTAEKPPNEFTADQVHEFFRSGTARFVDAREAKEYAEGHLNGAINLPSAAVYEKIGDVTSVVGSEEKVIVYCGGKTCESAKTVAGVLRTDFHYTDVMIYESGWEEITSCGKFEDCIVTGESN